MLTERRTFATAGTPRYWPRRREYAWAALCAALALTYSFGGPGSSKERVYSPLRTVQAPALHHPLPHTQFVCQRSAGPWQCVRVNAEMRREK